MLPITNSEDALRHAQEADCLCSGNRVPACSYSGTCLLSGRRVVVAQPRGVAREGSNGCRRGGLETGEVQRARPHLALVGLKPISACDPAAATTLETSITRARGVCELRQPVNPSRTAA